MKKQALIILVATVLSECPLIEQVKAEIPIMAVQSVDPLCEPSYNGCQYFSAAEWESFTEQLTDYLQMLDRCRPDPVDPCALGGPILWEQSTEDEKLQILSDCVDNLSTEQRVCERKIRRAHKEMEQLLQEMRCSIKKPEKKCDQLIEETSQYINISLSRIQAAVEEFF